jgi:phosphoglycolate phosphatase
MKKYSYFIFDFDNTLADSRVNISNSLNHALSTHKLPIVPAEHIWPLIGKKNIEDTFLHFYPTMAQETLTTCTESFRAYQKKYAAQELVIFPGVEDTLKKLYDQNKGLAILTTKNHGQITQILQDLPFGAYFETVFGSGLIDEVKPAKECVEYILANSNMKTTKQDCVMVGDSEPDVTTARNAGIDIIGVSYGTDGREKMASLGVTTILDSFSELVSFS